MRFTIPPVAGAGRAGLAFIAIASAHWGLLSLVGLGIAMSKERQAWALFVLRLLLGSTFVGHGSGKVLGLFGGPGLAGFAGMVGHMGIPAFLGYLAAFCEFVGGWLVLLGLGAEIGALLIAPVMLVAIGAVHWPHGYFGQNDGFEYPLNLLLVCLAVVIGGPGKLALWDPFRKRRQ